LRINSQLVLIRTTPAIGRLLCGYRATVSGNGASHAHAWAALIALAWPAAEIHTPNLRRHPLPIKIGRQSNSFAPPVIRTMVVGVSRGSNTEMSCRDLDAIRQVEFQLPQGLHDIANIACISI
jgi:hypothetical protein